MSPEEFTSKCQKNKESTKHYEDRLKEAYGVPKDEAITNVE